MGIKRQTLMYLLIHPIQFFLKMGNMESVNANGPKTINTIRKATFIALMMSLTAPIFNGIKDEVHHINVKILKKRRGRIYSKHAFPKTTF